MDWSQYSLSYLSYLMLLINGNISDTCQSFVLRLELIAIPYLFIYILKKIFKDRLYLFGDYVRRNTYD